MADDLTETLLVVGIAGAALYIVAKAQNFSFCQTFPSFCPGGNFNLLAPFEPGGAYGAKPGDVVIEPDGSQSILNADGTTTPVGQIAASQATAAKTGQAPGTPVVQYPGTPDGCWPTDAVLNADGSIMSIPAGAHYCSWLDAITNFIENPISTGPYQPL
jgi:hypothetical protein